MYCSKTFSNEKELSEFLNKNKIQRTDIVSLTMSYAPKPDIHSMGGSIHTVCQMQTKILLVYVEHENIFE